MTRRKIYEKVFYIIFILIPIIDSINGYLIQSNISLPLSFGQIYRFLVIAIMVVVLLEKVQKKRLLKIVTLVVYLISIQFSFFYIHQSPSGLIYDTTGILKLIFIFLIIEVFRTLNEREIIDFNVIEKIIVVSSLIIPLSIIIPYLLGIGFTVYESFEVGYRGFYNENNAINVVLLVLMTFKMNDIFDKSLGIKRKLFSAINLLLIIIATLLIGSKSSIFFTILITIIYFLRNIKIKNIIKNFKTLCAALFLFILCFFIIGNNYSDELKGILERQEYYLSTQDTSSFLLSSRNLFLENAIYSYVHSNNKVTRFIFGIGNYRKDQEISEQMGNPGELKGIEMDLFDVFFAYGIAGTLIIYGYFISILIKSLFINKTKNQKELLYKYYLSFFIVITFSTLGGHVLFSALSGSFFALICSGLVSRKITKIS